MNQRAESDLLVCFLPSPETLALLSAHWQSAWRQSFESVQAEEDEASLSGHHALTSRLK